MTFGKERKRIRCERKDSGQDQRGYYIEYSQYSDCLINGLGLPIGRGYRELLRS